MSVVTDPQKVRQFIMNVLGIDPLQKQAIEARFNQLEEGDADKETFAESGEDPTHKWDIRCREEENLPALVKIYYCTTIGSPIRTMNDTEIRRELESLRAKAATLTGWQQRELFFHVDLHEIEEHPKVSNRKLECEIYGILPTN